jgi:serine/threonine protein kinase
MLFGKTPFKGQDQKDTFHSILNKKLIFPDEPVVSKDAKDLIRQLLQADTEKRIGSKCGASDIMQHSFFKGLQFQLIRNMEPPYKPQIKNPLDTSHFRNYVENEEEKKVEEKAYVISENDPFKAFEFRGTGNKDLLNEVNNKPPSTPTPTTLKKE